MILLVTLHNYNNAKSRKDKRDDHKNRASDDPQFSLGCLGNVRHSFRTVDPDSQFQRYPVLHHADAKLCNLLNPGDAPHLRLTRPLEEDVDWA